MADKKSIWTAIPIKNGTFPKGSGFKIVSTPVGRYMDIFGLGSFEDDFVDESPEDMIRRSFEEVGDNMRAAIKELQLNP